MARQSRPILATNTWRLNGAVRSAGARPLITGYIPLSCAIIRARRQRTPNRRRAIPLPAQNLFPLDVLRSVDHLRILLSSPDAFPASWLKFLSTPLNVTNPIHHAESREEINLPNLSGLPPQNCYSEIRGVYPHAGVAQCDAFLLLFENPTTTAASTFAPEESLHLQKLSSLHSRSGP